MRTFVWPSEDGWPYPDTKAELPDLDGGVDDDLFMLQGAGPRLLELLDPLERQVVTAHYGLHGSPARTMKELHHDTGLSRAELREALAGGLAKLRHSLSE